MIARRGLATWGCGTSDVVAPRLLGFFYRRFGRSKMGNAFLTAHKAHLEQSTG